MQLLSMALVGLVAQLVDGSMGMAYGVTSASLLMLAGLSPAAASASVHAAELVTTALSGLAHRRHGNVHWPLVAAIALPGAAGAFVGAAFLSWLPASAARPYVAALLFGLGGWILVRYVRLSHIPAPAPGSQAPARATPARCRPFRPGLVALGALAGLADAVGGGGWGPLTTPILIASPYADPRRVVGSVDTAEFLVAAGATAGFLAAGRGQAVEPVWVAALVAGGAAAAPLAARIVSRVPPRLLGVGVGGLVMLTNAPSVLDLVGASLALRAALYGAVLAGWVAAAGLAAWGLRREAAAAHRGWYGGVGQARPGRSAG